MRDDHQCFRPGAPAPGRLHRPQVETFGAILLHRTHAPALSTSALSRSRVQRYHAQGLHLRGASSPGEVVGKAGPRGRHGLAVLKLRMETSAQFDVIEDV